MKIIIIIIWLLLPMGSFSQELNNVFDRFERKNVGISDKKINDFILDSVFKSYNDSVVEKFYLYSDSSFPKSIFGIPIIKIVIKTNSRNIILAYELTISFDSTFYKKVKCDIGLPVGMLDFTPNDDEMEEGSPSNFSIWVLPCFKLLLRYKRYDIDFGQKRNDIIIISFIPNFG